MNENAWTIFDLEKLIADHRDDAVPYHEFLRVPSLSCGIYKLAVGSTDMQSAHLEDEVYLVVEGRARVRVGDDLHEVGRGSILYVRATEQHSFFEVEEDITLLVFFASGGGGRSPYSADASDGEDDASE